MFAKKVLVFSLLLTILVVTIGLLANTHPAQAQGTVLAASGSSSCLRCHENRYYNYDTGNHYCLTVASTRCVDCHAGDPEALQEEAAHAGLVSYPIINGDISRCESCHSEDAQAHVDTFAALAGYSPIVHVARQVQPLITVESAVPEEVGTRFLLDTKAAIGVSVIMTVLVALFILCMMTNKACHL